VQQLVPQLERELVQQQERRQEHHPDHPHLYSSARPTPTVIPDLVRHPH
jgi:hypothetical protein